LGLAKYLVGDFEAPTGTVTVCFLIGSLNCCIAAYLLDSPPFFIFIARALPPNLLYLSRTALPSLSLLDRVAGGLAPPNMLIDLGEADPKAAGDFSLGDFILFDGDAAFLTPDAGITAVCGLVEVCCLLAP